MNLLLPCSAVLCAALSGPVMADNALPAAPSPCLNKPDAAQTPAQQRQQSRSTWRRHCYLADAERSDRQREMLEAKLSPEEVWQLLDDIQSARHAQDGWANAPLDYWLAHPGADGGGLAWQRAGGPGGVFSATLPMYRQAAYHTPWLPLGSASTALPMPAVPEPASYRLLLGGMAVLVLAAVRRRQRLANKHPLGRPGDTAPIGLECAGAAQIMG